MSSGRRLTTGNAVPTEDDTPEDDDPSRLTKVSCQSFPTSIVIEREPVVSEMDDSWGGTFEMEPPNTEQESVRDRSDSLQKKEQGSQASTSLPNVADKEWSNDTRTFRERFLASYRGNSLSRSSRKGSSIFSGLSKESSLADLSAAGPLETSSMKTDVDGSDPSLGSVEDYTQRQLLQEQGNKQKSANKRRDQIIDSLAWFSFHTPRTVLEDLIGHELDLWDYANGLGGTTTGAKLSLNLDKTNSQRSLATFSDHTEASREPGNESHCVPRDMMTLPYSVKRDSALLFVDITGFTKLSTLLDVESLSKVINSYFDMIVHEVLQHHGDILKFAGDAFFAEWRATPDDMKQAVIPKERCNHPLASLHSSIHENVGEAGESLKLPECVLAASTCAAELVKKFSDFHVSASREVSITFGKDQQGRNEAMLNVHCGIGVGRVVGLHVGDHHRDGDDGSIEMRREYLVLGDPIDQVSIAADAAKDGQVLASPEAILQLSKCCPLPEDYLVSIDPVCIAARDKSFLDMSGSVNVPFKLEPNQDLGARIRDMLGVSCERLDCATLARLHLQLARYVHPVVRGDDLASSASQPGTTAMISRDASRSRHRAEAELRSVYTMFIKAVMSPSLTGKDKTDEQLYNTLSDVMRVVCRELDRYSGHLRQFIVDDKGVVLIGTFGLRGSTFPNMVANNALPATFAIHTALKSELCLENRIGATFGKVYCGVAGGIRRHEFAVMGAPVNLAARLMYSPKNNGILVDEAVQAQADARFAFKSLPPVTAKGYDKPITIVEPLHAVSTNKKKGSAHAFIGRKKDISLLSDVAMSILKDPAPSDAIMAFIIGESGMGKTTLGLSICEEIRKLCNLHLGKVVALRSTSTETEQRIPLSSFRKIFLGAIKDFCIHDGTLSVHDEVRASTRLRRGSIGRSRSRRSSVGRTLSRRQSTRLDSFRSLNSSRSVAVPYFQKLNWICGQLGYAYEYADIVGSQLLGLEGAIPTTHIDGYTPTIDEIVAFLSAAYIRITDYSDLVLIFIDDFQWIDSLTWKVIRVLCIQAKNTLLIGAMRSHDKQALRRMSSVAAWHGQMQSRIIEVFLGPLELSEVKQLIANILGCEELFIEESLCVDVYNRTGGLPVYLVELLESIKRNKTVSRDESGMLRWTAAAENDQRRLGSSSVAVIEESFLNRFDSLEVPVRTVLQTCAVLGSTFSLSDVIQVHSEQGEADIENALDAAVDDLILVEDIEDDDDDDDMSLFSNSVMSVGGESKIDYRNAGPSWNAVEDRFFQFSHAMWRESVLKNMLKERKIELHRLIATAMEKDKVLIMESSDIARLLTLFDHWKSCGEFCKAAPLALAVGLRLDEWDLSAQSLDLYKDALEMCYESATSIRGREEILDAGEERWLLATAPPGALDMILRLHIRIGMCHGHVGNEEQCLHAFQDAYTIMTTSEQVARICRPLMLTVLAELCSVSMKRLSFGETEIALLEGRIRHFLREAQSAENPICISRALAMQASFFGSLGRFEEAVASHETLRGVYDLSKHSCGMVEEYGKDYAAQNFSDCAEWYCLIDEHLKGLKQAEFVIQYHVPQLEADDIDTMMEIMYPVLMVMKAMGRAKDADLLLKERVLNPYREHESYTTTWLSMFHPLAYLLELANMEDSNIYDAGILEALEEWVLEEEVKLYPFDLQMKGYMLIGEICWTLGRQKKPHDQSRLPLIEKCRGHLSIIVCDRDDNQSNAFAVSNAKAMLEALDDGE